MTSIADIEPIRVVIKPDPDEAARVLSRWLFRKPLGFVMAAGAVVGCLVIAVFGLWLIVLREQYIFGTFFAVFGCALLVFWPLAFRRALAKRIERTLADSGGRVVTFSRGGMDTKTPHTAAHVDWEAVKSARTVREGLLLQVDRSTAFISKRNFASEVEYASSLDLIGSMLGARADLSER